MNYFIQNHPYLFTFITLITLETLATLIQNISLIIKHK